MKQYNMEVSLVIKVIDGVSVKSNVKIINVHTEQLRNCVTLSAMIV